MCHSLENQITALQR